MRLTQLSRTLSRSSRKQTDLVKLQESLADARHDLVNLANQPLAAFEECEVEDLLMAIQDRIPKVPILNSGQRSTTNYLVTTLRSCQKAEKTELTSEQQEELRLFLVNTSRTVSTIRDGILDLADSQLRLSVNLT